MGGSTNTRPSAEALARGFDSFIHALPVCNTMIVSFDTKQDTRGHSATRPPCYCPLSECMRPWREIFNLGDQGECNVKATYSHGGLMGHLRSKEEGVHIIIGYQWHRIVWQYLNELYPTWNDTVHGDRKRGRDEGGPPGGNDEGTSQIIKRP